MNKRELVAVAAKETGLTLKTIEKALKGLTETIIVTVANKEEVQLIGFGTFGVRERAARTGKNPQNNKVMVISELNIPTFKAGRTFKKAVNTKPKNEKI